MSGGEGCQGQLIPPPLRSPLSRCQECWENTWGTRYPCHNPLLMAKFPHRSQEKEFMGSLICPGCTSLLFHTIISWVCLSLPFLPHVEGILSSTEYFEGCREPKESQQCVMHVSSCSRVNTWYHNPLWS